MVKPILIETREVHGQMIEVKVYPAQRSYPTLRPAWWQGAISVSHAPRELSGRVDLGIGGKE